VGFRVLKAHSIFRGPGTEEKTMGQAARIIDLDEFRKKKAEQTPAPAPIAPVPQQVWVWVWFPVWQW
jgi:hypothetical protein